MSDISTYLDLKLFDTDPLDISAAAIANAKVYFPALNFEEGSYEAAIVQVVANTCAELGGSANRMTRAVVLDLIYNFFQIQPDIGAAPSVPATLTVSSTVGITVNAGTLVELDLGDGSPLQFVLVVDAIVLPGDSTTTGSFMALSFTSKANGTLSGTTLRQVSASPTLTSVVTTAPIAGGRDPETLVSYLGRGVSVLANLSSTLTLARQFTNAAIQQTYVARATTIDRYDGAGGTPYTDNGHVTVVALGIGDVDLTTDQKAALVSTLSENSRVDLQVHVIDPTITPVDVTATVEVLPGSDSTVVHDAVVAALTAYLSPDSWAWGGTVYRNVLVQLMANVVGVNRVVSITTPATDFTLTGDGPLAAPGTILITP